MQEVCQLIKEENELKDFDKVVMVDQRQLKQMRERGEVYSVVGFYAGKLIIKRHNKYIW